MSPSSDMQEVVETYDLPSDYGALVRQIMDILKLGLVQEMTVRLGHPIRVRRYVRPDVTTDKQQMTTWQLVRQVDMKEVSPGKPGDTLFKMMSMVDERGLVPHRFLVTGNPTLLQPWSGLSLHDTLLGIPLLRVDEVPDDALILTGAPSPAAEMRHVGFAVKTTMIVEDSDDTTIVRDGIGGWPDPEGGGQALGAPGVG